jgi:hypothetical protein
MENVSAAAVDFSTLIWHMVLLPSAVFIFNVVYKE